MSSEVIRLSVPFGLAVLTAKPPALFLPHEKAAERFFDFFTANIRNKNTRRAYYKAACRFAEWREGGGVLDLAHVKPRHAAAYIEELLGELAKPTVKQPLAALRMLFDWLVVGHVLEMNPAHAVRGPKHVVKKGCTPVLDREEARALRGAIDTGSLTGLRDRAPIGVMIYTFARVGSLLQMNVGDYFTQGRRGWVRLHEKGGKEHEAPCHHKLEAYLDAYIEAAGLAGDRKEPLFRPAIRKTKGLSGSPMSRSDVWSVVRRRASDASIETPIGCHTFRATGIRDYLTNGGRIEVAQRMALHPSAKTTGLHDRRNDDVSLNEVERSEI